MSNQFVSMSPMFLVNYVTVRQQITKVKVDRLLSLVSFPDIF